MIDYNEPMLIDFFCNKYEDERGVFYNTFDREYFRDINFIIESQSISKKNVIRGLHYQFNKPQAKLIKVTKGHIQDVIVDLRFNSKTYGKVYYYDLSEFNRLQLWVPEGFAHGFCCLSEENHVEYKFTDKYYKDFQFGINAFDDELKIDWKVNRNNAIISQKDLLLQTFNKYKNNPIFKM